MRPIIRRGLLVGGVSLVIIGGIGFYLFMKPPEDVAKKKPEYKLTATELMKEYRHDPELANEKYLGTILEVSGTVRAINHSADGSTSFTLGHEIVGVTVTVHAEYARQMDDFLQSIGVGSEIKVKGRCDGQLTDVRISDCVFVN